MTEKKETNYTYWWDIKANWKESVSSKFLVLRKRKFFFYKIILEGSIGTEPKMVKII